MKIIMYQRYIPQTLFRALHFRGATAKRVSKDFLEDQLTKPRTPSAEQHGTTQITQSTTHENVHRAHSYIYRG